MSILVDTGFVYALFQPADPHHERAIAFSEANFEPMLLPAVILPELGFLFGRDNGYAGVIQWLEQFRYTEARMAPMIQEDLGRIYEIAEQYADSRFDVVDCCVMAMAERLQITKIATFDSRDFSIVVPSHTDYFEILP
ncbi:MAG: PIN domain-containing protein [Chloroflexota bacterium]|nr:PIN domain-containing protein [Chloroflexota bacterium]